MTKQEMQKVCHELHRIAEETLVALDSDNYEVAGNIISRVHIIGVGWMQDAIKRMREPTCEHKVERILSHTKMTVHVRCSNCGRTREVTVAEWNG